MEIIVEQLSKKFSREWIFKGIDYTLKSDQAYAIVGGNGSGKSTLLKILSGINDPSKGKITYRKNDKEIPVDEVWKEIVLAGPYTELVEEYTLAEHLNFHRRLKPLTKSNEEIIEILGFKNAANKQIQAFSSGMKQKLKLALAFFSEASILMLDEPTSNLDHKNIAWYQHWLPLCSKGKITLICSNQPYEYEFCEEKIFMENYK
ncbi:ABC transporter ATP-binding protein [Flammeovirga aprica]|uniref:ABC transporter ATP-binding protein n=1 Tax=Flammeovirga aprica JL-4 TaxID=694437 RepID=A0A7X9XAK0_9BACT|nr:ABC transporter ATP-binding protein [Flammeovirga aprica]NME69746.1 ABC transporter ATP-binding protein [Flammeovirga aprica JL-4]